MTSETEGSGPFRDSRPPHLWHIPSAEAMGYEVPPPAIFTEIVVRHDPAADDAPLSAHENVTGLVEKLAADPDIGDDVFIELDETYRPEG